MEFYFDCYGGLGLQRFMVSDQPRTDAFADAITEVVTPGDRVMDLGTGTGLLAMIAAKAGAKEVYAIDQATIADVAKELVKRNGLSDTIDVINANATDFQLAEPVDVLISEWLGHLAFVETMLDDVIDARDNNLKPGGIMLPATVDLRLAPIDCPYLYDGDGPGFWAEPVHGIDFSMLEEIEMQQAVSTKTDVPCAHLLAPGESLVSLDLATAKKEDPWCSGEVQFTMDRDGRLDGFVGWFDTQLSSKVMLGTGPNDPLTHWAQIHFAFPPFEVKEGEVITVKYSHDRHPYEKRAVELSLTVNGKTLNYTVG